jgi:hypothetical protein
VYAWMQQHLWANTHGCAVISAPVDHMCLCPPALPPTITWVRGSLVCAALRYLYIYASIMPVCCSCLPAQQATVHSSNSRCLGNGAYLPVYSHAASTWPTGPVTHLTLTEVSTCVLAAADVAAAGCGRQQSSAMSIMWTAVSLLVGMPRQRATINVWGRCC